jgi:zinc protease
MRFNLLHTLILGRFFVINLLITVSIAAWCLLSFRVSYAEESSSLLPAANIKVEQMTLANGMQIYVIPNHKTPAVVHMIWYRNGSRHDPAGVSGIAHFLEHLMFKGTATLKEGEFSSRIAKQGGTDNAFTAYDYTAYFQKIAVDTLPMVMEMEADRMQHLRLQPELVDKERQVILEERSMRVDNDPKELLDEQLYAALFVNHPYGRPVIGWRHEMEQLSLSDALQYYRHYYVPNNAFVVIAGDVTLAKIKPLIEKYYKPIPKRPIATTRTISEPTPIAARMIHYVDKRTERPLWRRYYAIPSLQQPERDGIALMILSYLLGAEGTGTLYEELVLAIEILPKKSVDFQRIEHALDQIIHQIQKDHINRDAFKRAKYLFRAEAIFARDGFQTLAFVLGHALAMNLPLSYVTHWDHHVQNVSLHDVQKALITVFQPEHSVTGYLTAVPAKHSPPSLSSLKGQP